MCGDKCPVDGSIAQIRFLYNPQPIQMSGDR